MTGIRAALAAVGFVVVILGMVWIIGALLSYGMLALIR